MIEIIINFFKRLFRREELLKIEAPKENVVNKENTNGFHENLKKSANDRIRLLDIQEDIKKGKISEKDLESKDITLLKELYCEQIQDMANSIEYYRRRIKSCEN